MNLSERDVLELLGYAQHQRPWLEIIGYEASTNGLRAFHAERPNLEPDFIRIVLAALHEAGQFPRTPRTHGVYLRKTGDQAYVVTEFLAKDEWCHRTYADATAAARYLLRRQMRYDYVLAIDTPEAPRSIACTPKWRRRHPRDCFYC